MIIVSKAVLGKMEKQCHAINLPVPGIQCTVSTTYKYSIESKLIPTMERLSKVSLHRRRRRIVYMDTSYSSTDFNYYGRVLHILVQFIIVMGAICLASCSVIDGPIVLIGWSVLL